MAATSRKTRTSPKRPLPARGIAGIGLQARKALAAASTRAVEARDRTLEAVSQLEKIFERRVSRAISRLGVPTSRDVHALSRQVAELQASVERLKRARAKA